MSDGYWVSNVVGWRFMGACFFQFASPHGLTPPGACELTPAMIAAAAGLWIGAAVTGEIIGIGGACGAAGGLPLLPRAGVVR